jgi:hypothetical protein
MPAKTVVSIPTNQIAKITALSMISYILPVWEKGEIRNGKTTLLEVIFVSPFPLWLIRPFPEFKKSVRGEGKVANTGNRCVRQ